MLDPRLIALQGLEVPLSPIAIAVQGLITEILAGLFPPPKPPDSAGSWAKKRGERVARAERERRARVLRDDEELVQLVGGLLPSLVCHA